MKDFISKVTFGFLMAQLVPGIITIYVITFVTVAFTGGNPEDIGQVAQKAIEIWSTPLSKLLVFSALSLGAGMAIHGLHWAVLGFLEYHYAERQDGEILKLKPVFQTFWHNWPPYLQIMAGPIKIVIEILLFLFSAKNLSEVAIDENIPKMPNDKVEAFRFLQEFYLHFLQFYAHTAYALAATLPLVVITIIWSPGLEFSTKCVVFAIMAWMACGFFFLISRIQIASLFKAESLLKNSNNSHESEIQESTHTPD